MRYAFEDQESEGRVVVEEVAVGGQVVCHRQPDSLNIVLHCIAMMDHIS